MILMKIPILIDENKIDQFWWSFYHKKYHFCGIFHVKFIIFFDILVPWVV